MQYLYELLKISKEELQNVLKGKKIIISISGMDNVGKSTQAKKLHDEYNDLISSPLHINQTDAFPKLKGKDLSLWWFNKQNAENFVDTIYKALSQRYQMAQASNEPIIIMDKGIDFYDTRVKATLITEGYSQEQILEMMTKAKSKYRIFNSLEDLKIIITAHNRDHIKEKTADDENYAKYINYNIEILNEKLNQDKYREFRQVEFIENGLEEMHKQIVSSIANTIKVRTQYERYQAIIESAKQSFGDNLSLLTLAGSAGKGKFVENWSDLDVYIVLKNFKISQVKKLNSLLPKDIHIGSTIYTEKEIETGKINNRSKVMFYELNQGKNVILFKDPNSKLPTININEILREDTSEYADAVHNLRRCLIAGKDSNRTSLSNNDATSSKILKNIILLEKIALRNSDIAKVSGGYADTNMAFLDLLMDAHNNGFSIEEKYMKFLLSVDLLKCVQRHEDPAIQDLIWEYGVALLVAIEAVDDFNRSKKQTEVERLQ